MIFSLALLLPLSLWSLPLPPPRNDGFGDNGGYDNFSRSTGRPVPPPAAPPMPDPGMSGDAGAEGGVDDIPF